MSIRSGSSGRSLQRQIREMVGVVRLTPFDTSTEEGRSRERYRRAMLAAGGSMLAKGVTALTTLISVPLTVNYLGAERYGMWMTISSLITILSFADLGIGNGLVNSISEAEGRGDRTAATKYVSSSFFILLGVGVLILMLYFLTTDLIPWPKVFNVKSPLAIGELGPALAIFMICFGLNIPLGVVEKLQTGYQEGFINSIWQGIGSLLALTGVLFVIHLESGLPWLVMAMAGAPVLTTMINGIVQFWHRRPWLRPHWRHFEWATSRRLTSLGAIFLVLQVLTIAGMASDNFIIAQLYGAAAVAGYAVIQKLFSLALIPHYLVAPLWPAFGEALARRDYAWAERTLYRSILIGCLFEVALVLPLLIWGRDIVAFWLNASLVPGFMLLLGFSCDAILGAYRSSMSMFLNSSHLLRRQSVFYAVAAILALISKIVMGYYFALPGIIWGTVLAFGIFYAIPAWILARRIFAEVRAS